MEKVTYRGGLPTKKFFFLCSLTRNCKCTLNFLALTNGLFTFNQSLWNHWSGITSIYSVLFYSPLEQVFLVQTSFASDFDFKQKFLWWIEQNKMNKGVIICLHHYLSFYFKFVCFPWCCVGNFPLMNVKTKLD